MKHLLQKTLVVCVMASMAGVAYGYNHTLQNTSPYRGQIDLRYAGRGVCGTDTKAFGPYEKIAWGHASGCLATSVVGYIVYENPENTRFPGPIVLYADPDNNNAWSSDGVANVDLVVSVDENNPNVVPKLEIKRVTF